MTRRTLIALTAAATLGRWTRQVAAQTATGPYYVSPTGSDKGDGTRERPWPTIESALRKVGGGQTIIVMPGTYVGRAHIPRLAAGKPTAPTVIRAEAKWEAVLTGSTDHGVFMEEGTDWVVFDGLQVAGCIWNGFRVQGNYVTVRNCYVHNCSHMGLSAHGRDGTVIERNLIEYNGRHPLNDQGIYADGSGLLIRANVVRHNSGCGIHLYPNANGCVVLNNVVHGYPSAHGIIVWSTPTATDPGGGNVIAFNTVSDGMSAIQLFNGTGSTIAYNLSLGEQSAIYTRGTIATVEGNNMKILGKPSSTNDPSFVDAFRHVFWLKSDSKARNEVRPMPGGNPIALPAEFQQSLLQSAFFGQLPAARTEVGAYQYYSALESPTVRSAWVTGWPYQRPSSATVDANKQPDLWAVLTTP